MVILFSFFASVFEGPAPGNPLAHGLRNWAGGKGASGLIRYLALKNSWFWKTGQYQHILSTIRPLESKWRRKFHDLQCKSPTNRAKLPCCTEGSCELRDLMTGIGNIHSTARLSSACPTLQQKPKQSTNAAVCFLTRNQSPS